jgi:hypothetical protein
MIYRLVKGEIGEFRRQARLTITKKKNVFRSNVEMSNTFSMEMSHNINNISEKKVINLGIN